MSADPDLLRDFTDRNSEAAFAELVRRHVNLVYSVALRIVGRDSALAEDVTQAVFVALARKAPTLTGRASLTGWLYTSAHHAACAAVCRERRRQARELKAHAMNDSPAENEGPADWERLRPLLDDAMHTLSTRDREAVLLRFFEGKPFAEIGARLELGENAARMRVERALDKLRHQLARRGIASTASALSLALAQHAVVAAPPGLAAGLPGAALAAGATAGGGTWLGGMLAWSKLQTGAALVCVLGGVAGLLWQGSEAMRLRAEIDQLRQAGANGTRRLAQHRTVITTQDDDRGQLAAAVAQARSENEALRAQLDASSAQLARETGLLPDIIPVEHLTNSGRNTPGAALETLFWAFTQGNLAELERSMTFSPAVQERLAAVLARWPADGAGAFPSVATPGQLVAMLWSLDRSRVAGMRMYAAWVETPERMKFSTQWQFTSGQLDGLGMTFVQTPGGWKWSMSDEYVLQKILPFAERLLGRMHRT